MQQHVSIEGVARGYGPVVEDKLQVCLALGEGANVCLETEAVDEVEGVE